MGIGKLCIVVFGKKITIIIIIIIIIIIVVIYGGDPLKGTVY